MNSGPENAHGLVQGKRNPDDMLIEESFETSVLQSSTDMEKKTLGDKAQANDDDIDIDDDEDIIMDLNGKDKQKQLQLGDGGSRPTTGPDDDGDLDEAEDDAFELITATNAKKLRDRISKSKVKMKMLMERMGQNEQELSRYEAFRRSGFKRGNIKKFMQSILNQTAIHQNCVIVAAGVAKVLVGELTEEALNVMKEMGEEGPIFPSHLREAHRRLKRRGVIPSTSVGTKAQRGFP